MTQKLHKVRNQRLDMSNKTSGLSSAFGITKKDVATKCAEGFVVDCNKRGKDGTTNKTPRMTS